MKKPVEEMKFTSRPSEKVKYLYADDITKIIKDSPIQDLLIAGIERAERSMGTISKYREVLHEKHNKHTYLHNKSIVDKRILEKG